MMWSRRPYFLSVVLGLLVAASVSCSRPPEQGDDTPPPPPASNVTDLDVGLSSAETGAWRWTSEGSDLVPVDILRALTDVNWRAPFSESLVRYGFLPSPAGPGNPYGLPVGWTIDVPKFSLLRLDYTGVNCSACHTGQVEYRGQALRIDGAPNMADIEAFGLAVRDSVAAMLEDPAETFLFVARLVSLEPPAGADPEETFAGQLSPAGRSLMREYAEDLRNDRTEVEDAVARGMGRAFARIMRRQTTGRSARLDDLAVEGFDLVDRVRERIRGIYEFVGTYVALAANRADLATRAIHAFETSPVAGPGRDDPWGIIRNLVFFTETRLTAPTSIPHLFETRELVWYHADGNTNSVMQRNIAQAVALGAYVDAQTKVSTLRPRAIWALEDLMAKLESPAWPESVFGPIDAAAAVRGAEVFRRKLPAPGGAEFSCADCHDIPDAPDGILIAPDEVGTDPNRARSFLRPQDGKPFWVAIPEKVSEIEAVAFREADITPEEAREHENVRPPEWRGTGKYVARRLHGVWSTAPYLHNASVPTLHDLLLPAGERPATFPVGHRDYDPEKVGYTTDVAEPIFVFDTTVEGNSNAGHEYGAALDETERRDLVEYLKTL